LKEDARRHHTSVRVILYANAGLPDEALELGQLESRNPRHFSFEGDLVSISTIVVVVAAIAAAAWAIGSYNGLVRLRNQAANGWRQIDVQLKRRHDLIPNLVNAVRGSMDFERDTLTAVVDARTRAQAASGPADAGRKEQELSQALGRLLVVAERYPALKSSDNVRLLQEELSATENKVGFARQFYNDAATAFNTAQEVFPTNILARTAGFKPSELFQITDATERAVPVVDLASRQ
jgi:LemA protein